MPKKPPQAASKNQARSEPPRRFVVLDDRIPSMADHELKSLLANAERLAASADDDRHAEAQRLLPLVSAEVEARATAKAETLRAKQAELRQHRAEAARARRRGATDESGSNID